MPEILSEEDFYQTIVAISAKEGLGGAAWVKIKVHDKALRVAYNMLKERMERELVPGSLLPDLRQAEADLAVANEQVTALRATVTELEAGLKARLDDLAVMTKERDEALEKFRGACDNANDEWEGKLDAIARERTMREALDRIAVAPCEGLTRNEFAAVVAGMARDALSGLAAPSPACPSCERMRREKEALRTGISQMRWHAERGHTENVGLIADNLRAGKTFNGHAIYSEADAALTHAEGAKEERVEAEARFLCNAYYPDTVDADGRPKDAYDEHVIVLEPWRRVARASLARATDVTKEGK